MKKVVPVLMLLLVVARGVQPDAGDYFTIEVVDEQTGRGVPLP